MTTPTTPVDEEQMNDYLGSDIDRDGLIELLCEIANGEYKAEELYSDAINYESE